jgi:hypothetical protein
MVRALYSAYNGPIYQVRRSSDNTTHDIELRSRGGYANAATQDSFCSGTTCYITKIYDQSSHHNDLTKANDNLSHANWLPVTIAGHNVYGLKIQHWNMGYGRHDTDGGTTGMPTGAQAQGTYMVTSGNYTNDGCCFDYGNTEMKIENHGAGTMAAIYFGSVCRLFKYDPCVGTGPWVGDDMEQGVFYSSALAHDNASDTGVTYPFVTAMIKDDGNTTWVRKTGNAQSGGLTSWYSGGFPTQGCVPCGGGTGYAPTHKEGGLTLGQGGDGSSGADGEFFEGAVVLGLPSDATENAVQANIVSVRYSGRHR